MRSVHTGLGDCGVMPLAEHPGDAQLRQFAAGALAVENLEQVAEHLGACRKCRDRVDEIAACDGFLGRLREANSSSDELFGRADERRAATRALRHAAEHPSAPSDFPPHEPAAIPREVGPYVVLREVGRGGMGVVYQARHGDLERPVALKMILAGDFASEVHRQRFRREAELAARIQHPNIVQVYEIAVHQGRPYLALEWCDGGSLAARIGPEGWPPRQAAAHVATLTEAIEAAHRRGVVHRDLKPSNILLQSSRDPGALGAKGIPTPKVADFGLALALERESGLTSTGQTVGTPEYMAPEQAVGKPARQTADIYALGAILYELLTGRPPFRGDTALEVLHALANDEPVAPRRLRPSVPRDLEIIVLKALEKEPSMRYSTASKLGDDLRSFLASRPINAKPPSLLDRLLKWTRRRPGLAVLTGALLVVLLGAFVAITTLWVDAAGARDQSRAAGARAQRQREAERRTRYIAGISAAGSALELDHADEARSLLADLPEEHRNWEWRYLTGLLDNATFVFRPEAPVKAFDLAPDGKLFAYALAGSSELRLRKVAEPSDSAHLGGLRSEITAVAFSADGTTIAAGTSDGTIRDWRVGDGALIATLPGRKSAIFDLSLDHTASRLLLTDHVETSLWIVAVGQRVPLGGIWSAQFSPDGQNIACLRNGDMRLYSAVDARPIVLPDIGFGAVNAAAFSPDGLRIAIGGRFPVTDIVIRPLSGDDRAIVLKGHENSTIGLEFSPDGRRLVSGSLDQTARIWDAATGSCLAVVRGHRAKVFGVCFASDGRSVLTRSEDGAIQLSEESSGVPLISLRGHAGVSSSRISRRGKIVAVADKEGTMRIWDLDRAIRRGVLRGHTSFVYDVAITGDGRWVASSSWDKTVRFWDQADTGNSLGSQKLGGFVMALAASPVGHGFVSVERTGALRAWKPPDSSPCWTVPFETEADHDGRAVWHPKGGIVALAGTRGWSAQFHDAATGRQLGGLPLQDGVTGDVAFSPDGKTVVTAHEKGAVRLWDFASRLPRAVGKNEGGRISRIAFNPSGSIIASASNAHSVDIWDAATLEPLAALKHAGQVYGIAFNPDGSRLATACEDNTIRLWDMRRFDKVAELRGHQAYVHAVAFSADGTRLVSASGDQTVRIWDAPSPSNAPGSTFQVSSGR
jgi:eukaryotic-like serine/threonine-protein kinase